MERKSATIEKLARVHFLVGGFLAQLILTIPLAICAYLLSSLPYSDAFLQVGYVLISFIGSWYGVRYLRTRYVLHDTEIVARLSTTINLGVGLGLLALTLIFTWFTMHYFPFGALDIAEMSSQWVAAFIVYYLAARHYLAKAAA